MTIKAAKKNVISNLRKSMGDGEAKSIAKILLRNITGYTGISLLLNEEEKLKETQIALLENALIRLSGNEPIQYIVGKAFFIDFELIVDKNVLIPRPETEELVRWIESEAQNKAAILDIGTGSGCIPLGLKYLNNTLEVSACDVSISALSIAKKNAEQLKLPVHFFELDILKPNISLPQKFDIIIANPPYIPPSEKKLMPEHVLQYEPALALFSREENPLEFYEAICTFAQNHLTTNGTLYFELNEFYATEIEQIMKNAAFNNIELKKDFQGKFRMIKGER